MNNFVEKTGNILGGILLVLFSMGVVSFGIWILYWFIFILIYSLPELKTP